MCLFLRLSSISLRQYCLKYSQKCGGGDKKGVCSVEERFKPSLIFKPDLKHVPQKLFFKFHSLKAQAYYFNVLIYLAI